MKMISRKKCSCTSFFKKNKNFYYRKKNTSGSITIEAAIVVPTIILVLIALIVAFMILYQKAILVKAATQAAQQGAEIWTDSRKDIMDGSWDNTKERDSLYFRLFDSSFSASSTMDLVSETKQEWEKTGNSIKGAKTLKVFNCVKTGLKRGLMKPKITKVDLDYTNCMVEGKLDITITQEIEIPLGWIKSFFDGKNTLTLTAKGVAVVEQPAEYIRNIDFALEYASKLKDSIDFGGILGGLKAKLKK